MTVYTNNEKRRWKLIDISHMTNTSFHSDTIILRQCRFPNELPRNTNDMSTASQYVHSLHSGDASLQRRMVRIQRNNACVKLKKLTKVHHCMHRGLNQFLVQNYLTSRLFFVPIMPQLNVTNAIVFSN
eukprot:385974_1